MEHLVNPLLRYDYPDPDVIRVNDTYYMVSTTMHFFPGGAILRSYDLKDWEIAGYIFDKLEDTPDERMAQERTIYGGGMWAPCIRYNNGVFYVVFLNHSSGKTYLYQAVNISGPWKKTEIEGSYHDCSLLFDDDGRKYLVYGNRTIHLLELNDELSGPKEGGVNRVILEDTCEGLGYEGAHFYKINGHYYVFLIHWPAGSMRTQCCFKADSIDGEFAGGEVLCSDRGYCGQGVAQGGIVESLNGKWYGVLFQDMGAVGRIPVLVPVTWSGDMPVFGLSGKVPNDFEVVGSRPGYRYEPLYQSDRFFPKPDLPKNRQLGMAWQWNHQPDHRLWRLLPEGGLEITTDKICSNMVHAKNCLTQRMHFPKCMAEVTIDASGIQDRDIAGLCVLQSCYGLIGITKELENYYLVKIVRHSENLSAGWNAADFLPGEVEAKIRLNSPIVKVCLKANFEEMKDRLDFYYSVDDRYTKVGGFHKMKFRLDHFTGCRFGLVYFSTRKAGGSCVFKEFEYELG